MNAPVSRSVTRTKYLGTEDDNMQRVISVEVIP